MKYRMRDLENFAFTVNCDTMGEAARKLRMSQPALSESIQRLEADLGASVFYRSRAGIQLTPTGRVFLSKVSGLLSSVQNLEIDTTGESVFAGQTVSLGCHLTVASYALPQALLKLRETARDFQIELKHDSSRNIQLEIQRGRLDLGIVINPVRVPDLVIVRLGFDLVSVWSKSGAFATDTLIFNPHILQSRSILKKWRDHPRKTIETDGLELICRLVAKGLGYGIIPTKAVELSNERLVAVKSLPNFKDEIALVYRPEFGKTRAEKAMIEALKFAFSGSTFQDSKPIKAR